MKHSEHMTVLEGRVEITVDGKKRILQAGDETVVIPPYVVHGFQGFPGERLVVREVADPPGAYKAEYVLFFSYFLPLLPSFLLLNSSKYIRSFLFGDFALTGRISLPGGLMTSWSMITKTRFGIR